jgi:hypothetical protein
MIYQRMMWKWHPWWFHRQNQPRPSVNDLTDPEKVYILTLATWDPHLDVYAMNEESMLDWEGRISPD